MRKEEVMTLATEPIPLSEEVDVYRSPKFFAKRHRLLYVVV